MLHLVYLLTGYLDGLFDGTATKAKGGWLGVVTRAKERSQVLEPCDNSGS